MNATKPPTIAELLGNDTQVREPMDVKSRSHLRHRLLILVAVAAALLATWMAFAPPSRAMVAPPQIKMDTPLAAKPCTGAISPG
jgi:hypothetical protein